MMEPSEDRPPVLITGGAGYIGSHAGLALLDAGRRIVVVDDLSTGRRTAVPDGVPFHQGRAGDVDLIREVIARHGCTEVMHFAGSIIVPESVGRPLDYYENNVVSSARLLRACQETDVESFVFSSTAAVYDGSLGEPLREEAPLAPANPYGRGKLMTEQMIRDLAAAGGPRFAILRYFNVAGADPAGRSGQYSKVATHLIKRACQAAVGLLPGVDIYGEDYPTPDGTGLRDYIHVSDLADAHLAALDHLAAGGDSLTLNCGYGRGFSVRQVLDVVDRVAGQPIPRNSAPRRAGDAASLISDTRRIREMLNWRPRRDDLRDIVASALAWERRLLQEDREMTNS